MEELENEENKRTILRIKKWLDDYPNHEGIVVLFDQEKMDVVDLANTTAMYALTFAYSYLKHVEETTGFTKGEISNADTNSL